MGFLGIGNYSNQNNPVRTIHDLAADQPSDPNQVISQANVNLQQQNVANAEQFRANLPDLEKQYGQIAKDNARSQLAQQIAGIKSGASSRGLLHSGLRQGAEASAASKNLAGLAETQTNINSQLENQANQYDQNAIGGGLDLQNLQQQALNIAYQQKMNQSAATSQAIGSGIGAAAQIGSALFI